jgi:hypothetical protein
MDDNSTSAAGSGSEGRGSNSNPILDMIGRLSAATTGTVGVRPTTTNNNKEPRSPLDRYAPRVSSVEDTMRCAADPSLGLG